ncbi:L-cystine transmembrane transporter [Aureococcus anophagefferens]|nr:L-cystine transmembrane transporter [Aureococcus anophagefferens]
MKVCDDRLAETLDRANGFLEKSGGEFLGGDAPSISGVAMATLAAPLVLPAKFARGKYASPFEQLLAQDAEMQAQVEAYRATPVGAHALKVYEHRSTASSPLDGERIPTAAKPPGAVGSIGATSVPGVVAASVAGVVGADHKRDIGYHAFFGTGDPNLSVKRPFLNEPSPESVASTPPLWARKAAEDAPEPPTLRSLEAEVLAVVDGADAGAVLCANLPKLYYALHGAPLNCATYGEDRLSDLLGKLPNVYVRAEARGRGGTVSRRGTGAEDGDVPDAAALEAQAAGRLAYRAAGVHARVRDWSPNRLREASGATESSAAEALYQAVAAPGDRVKRTGLLLAHAWTAPVTAEPEKLRALAAEILALVDEAPGGKVLSANLPRAYFLKYRKPLDMKGYGALKMSRLLTALEPYGLESCGGANAGVGRAGSGVADDGPVADTIAPPPEDLASLRAELESMRGAGDAEELGRTVFVRGLPWTAEEAEVRSWMARNGPVASLVLPLNRGDGRPSGTAFVVFEAPAGAEKACAALGLTLGGGEFFPGTKRRVTAVMADRPCPTRRRESGGIRDEDGRRVHDTGGTVQPAVAKPPKQGKTIDPAGCDASPAELARLAAQILALCDAARSGRVLLGNLPGDYKKAYGAPMPSHGVKAKTLMALLPGVAVGGYDPSHVDPDNRWARA